MADYLLGARDATGQLRAGVEVLRGDPHQVAAVADALAFEHKYTSGVVAWAPDDAPTDAQIGAVRDAFERTAWVGLEPDRYATPSTPNRAGAGRMTRRELGCSNPGTAPTSRRPSCGPALRSSPPRAT